MSLSSTSQHSSSYRVSFFSPPSFNTMWKTEQTNFPVPEQRTWYEDTCIPASELPSLDEVLIIPQWHGTETLTLLLNH